MRFCVLGPLEVLADDRRALLEGGRQRSLLALLIIHAGQVVSRDRLIDGMWAGEPPPSASQSLDVYVSRLRKAFRDVGAEDVLRTRAPGYLLDAQSTDAQDFERLAAEGAQALAAGDPERARKVLGHALGLWRGDAYADVADEPWARVEARRLDELRLAVIEGRFDADLSLGRDSSLVGELELLVSRHPTRERLVAQLMLALYRSGRQADALAAYRAARHSLVEELGLEPGPALRDLESAILAHDPNLKPQAKTSRAAPAPVDRSRSRPLRQAAIAVSLIAAALIGTAVVLAHRGSGPGRSIIPNGVGEIDAASGRVTASTPVGSSPAGITVGAGSLWVTNGADGTVTRVDPRAAHVEQTLMVGDSPAGIAFGAGAVWAANALDGTVSRIDAQANRVVQTITVGQRPIAIAVGLGAVWVADDSGDAVVPVDPLRGLPERPIQLTDSPGGVALGFGSVWVTEPLAHKLIRIDPRSRAILAEIAVGAGARSVAAGAGAVWVVNDLDGTLARIDPARNAVASSVPVGDAPTAVAAGPDRIWVSDAGASELVQVDPGTGAVVRRDKVGAAPVSVALLGETPWVATAAPAGHQHHGGTLRVAYSAIQAFDPAVPFDVHPAIWRATGDGLVAVANSSGVPQLVPDLATSVPVPTDGGRTYVFQLRGGVRYWTGEPVRASDVRRELERLYAAHSQVAGTFSALRGAAACERRPVFCDLSAGVIANDRAGTIILRLTHPQPDLLFRLTLPAARPVPPGTPRTRIAIGPVPSTGPYRVTQFIPGRRLLLARNKWFREWSQAAQPDGYPDQIDIHMDDDPTRRAQSVLRGDADLALEITDADLAPLRIQFPSQLRTHAQANTSFLSFNVRRPPFDSALARRAVNLSIDRAAISRRLGGSGISTPTCKVLPPHFPGYQQYCPWTRAPHDGHWNGPDIARATSLVRRSGTAGAAVTFISPRNDPIAAAAIGSLVSSLRRIGYRPRVIRDDSEYFRRLGDPRGNWSISEGDWVADYASPSDFLDYFLSCSNYHPSDPSRTTNSGGFCNAIFDQLITQAERLDAGDPATAEKIWAHADRLAVDQAAWVPLENTDSADLLSRRTGHFTLDANSLPQIDQLWVR